MKTPTINSIAEVILAKVKKEKEKKGSKFSANIQICKVCVDCSNFRMKLK